MFSRWLYSPRNYIMSILMLLGVYVLALEELTYSAFGRITEGEIVRIEVEQREPDQRGPRELKLHHYEYQDAKTGTTVSGVIRGGGGGADNPWKVGTPIPLQYVPGWESWKRPSNQQKPWLGWGILIGSCILLVIGIRFGREASDPFREAREKRLKGRR